LNPLRASEATGAGIKASVADVSADGVKALLAPDQDHLDALIQRKYPYEPADIAG
jgi:hypothetical protein